MDENEVFNRMSRQPLVGRLQDRYGDKAVLVGSVIGVILSKYWTMPWTGFKYESFGAVREAGRLWWAAAEQRLSGFDHNA